jgi:pimeloyl-ACP methyl ester carboxylesterase
VPEKPEGSLRTTACPFDASKALLAVECGELTVPEDYDDPKSRPVKIAFMVVKASPNRDPQNPVLSLNGGPGGTSLVNAERLAVLPAIRQLVIDRDWVFFDQRGAGRSIPALHCPTLPDWKAVQACRDRYLQQGIDLSQYTSARISSDVEALRKALRVKQWNLWGSSYGSRLAFTVVRYYPSSVRAIIHEAPQLPESQVVVDDNRGTEAALDAMMSKCAADGPCASRFPQLRSRFIAALPKLRQRPVVAGGKRLDDAAVVNFIREWLFEGFALTIETRVQYLLAYMDAAARLDGRALARIDTRMTRQAEIERTRRSQQPGAVVSAPYPVEGDYHVGLRFSVDCNEEKAFESMDEYRQAASQSEIVRSLFGADGGEHNFRICSYWPAGRAEAIENSHVNYEGPQLVFTGELDASLSGLAGYEIAKLYPNATNVVFIGGTHGQVPISNADLARDFNFYRPCALELARQFFADPKQRLDTSCANARSLRLVQ